MFRTFATIAPQLGSKNDPKYDEDERSEEEDPLSFHEVMREMGKTVFRPGGTEATHLLHEWSQLQEGHSALEISAGLGTSGIALAQARQCHVTILAETKEDALLVQDRTIRQQHMYMEHLLEVDEIIEDVKDLDKDDLNEEHHAAAIGNHLENKLKGQHFTAVISEALLTHCPFGDQRKILTTLQPHTDQILLHNVCLVGTNTTDHKLAVDEVTEALSGDKNPTKETAETGPAFGGFYPRTVDGWKDLVTDCGYFVTHVQSGPLASMNPKQLWKDEGPQGCLKLAWNLVTHPEWREHVIAVKKAMDQHHASLGYVVLRAQTTEPPPPPTLAND